MKIEKTCEECSKIYFAWPSHHRRFCSQSCAMITSWRNPETRKRRGKKISIAKLGKPRPDMQGDKNPMKKPEARRKLSQSCQGRHISVEQREKLRQANLGKHLSEETKAKQRKALLGSKCHLWRGGKSLESYGSEFNKTLKRQIRERDKHTCQNCGKSESKEVHHINYDKKDNRPSNLITLCNSCHCKTNFKRGFWTGMLYMYQVLHTQLGGL